MTNHAIFIRLSIMFGFSLSNTHAWAMTRPCLHPRAIHKSSCLFTTSPSSGSETLKPLNYEARTKCWRPTIQDVERISWGKPAKKKGTGSRGVPHRLNQEERLLFDQARRNGFLQVGGSGWRAERRDAPLLNSYRNLCDARGQVCIVLHKGNTGMDQLVLDLSPLRYPEQFVQLEHDVVQYVDLDPCYRQSQLKIENGIPPANEATDEAEENDNIHHAENLDDSWENFPIYQLPAYYIAWEMERSLGKQVGKQLAAAFHTVEANALESKKPLHVKPGKSRRHGGYGIG